MTTYSVDVRVTAAVNDTEVEERVRRAIETLFPNADVEREGDRLVATTHSVEAFADRLREQRILDTARGHLRAAETANGFAFDLKKGPALHGVVNFAVGDPSELGDVHVSVTVRSPDVDAFVDYLAPETDAEGRPVDDPRA